MNTKHLPTNTNDEGQFLFTGNIVVSGLLGGAAFLDLASVSLGVLLGVLLGAQEILTNPQLDGVAADQLPLGEDSARAQHLLGGLQL